MFVAMLLIAVLAEGIFIWMLWGRQQEHEQTLWVLMDQYERQVLNALNGGKEEAE